MGGGGCCIGDCCVMNCCVGKAIKDFFFGKSKGSSSGGKTESYQTDTADLQATIKVQNALTEFRIDTQSRSSKLENEIIKESRIYLDSFLEDMKKYNKIRYGNRRLNINLTKIECDNRKNEDEIHGFIVKRIIKRISLDDNECLKILQMDPGKEKEKSLDAFYKKVLKEAVIELSDMLSSNMEKQTDNICDRIHQRIDSIIDVCESKTEEFETIRLRKEAGESEVEQEQLRLANIISICEIGLSCLD